MAKSSNSDKEKASKPDPKVSPPALAPDHPQARVESLLAKLAVTEMREEARASLRSCK